MHKVLPVINAKGSDSAMLDNTRGVSCDERNGSAACGHDHDSGAVGEQQDNEPEKDTISISTMRR